MPLTVALPAPTPQGATSAHRYPRNPSFFTLPHLNFNNNSSENFHYPHANAPNNSSKTTPKFQASNLPSGQTLAPGKPPPRGHPAPSSWAPAGLPDISPPDTPHRRFLSAALSDPPSAQDASPRHHRRQQSCSKLRSMKMFVKATISAECSRRGLAVSFKQRSFAARIVLAAHIAGLPALTLNINQDLSLHLIFLETLAPCPDPMFGLEAQFRAFLDQHAPRRWCADRAAPRRDELDLAPLRVPPPVPLAQDATSTRARFDAEAEAFERLVDKYLRSYGFCAQCTRRRASGAAEACWLDVDVFEGARLRLHFTVTIDARAYSFSSSCGGFSHPDLHRFGGLVAACLEQVLPESCAPLPVVCASYAPDLLLSESSDAAPSPPRSVSDTFCSLQELTWNSELSSSSGPASVDSRPTTSTGSGTPRSRAAHGAPEIYFLASDSQ
eukprot:gnl/Chilomastix_cuspidata/459.p1 GENE.gnl/Chilomastix_cuspidata/459~~gnl/Chilomastix_cuspidata/459.p1  ORF type:complete len:441 (-),score=125.72 gnl/Chilomastix_cuspidata/459:886-2208(-)